jgi:hypothetical protein
MDLAELQRKLLGLIRTTYQATTEDEPYIQTVAQSKHLEVMYEIVVFWRSLGIERYCVLTASLLKKRGLFDENIETLIKTQAISPFVEKLGRIFVDMMSQSEDDLIASVAQFESAFIKIKHGDPNQYVVDWHYEPYAVLTSLIRDLPLEQYLTKGSYQTLVSAELPNGFEVVTLG